MNKPLAGADYDRQHRLYDCPCIVAWPVSGSNGNFLDWIGRQVDPRSPEDP